MRAYVLRDVFAHPAIPLLFLPIRINGCGLQSKVTRCSTEYLGGIQQGLDSLLDRRQVHFHDDGSTTTTVTAGALNIPSIAALLGARSFDAGNTTPWATLLSHEESSLAVALKAAWSDIQSHLTEQVNITPRLSALQQPVEAAGTYADGSFPRSVTEFTSRCLDTIAYELLPQLNHSEQERLAILNCKGDRYCRQFLGSLPNHTGYIEDTLFPECFTAYLGVPSPACEPLAGGWIGTDPRQTDVYGNSIASSQTVPGGGHTIVHDSHKDTLNDILQISGFHTIKEAQNIFRGKVSTTHHDSYVQQFIRGSGDTRRGIIPDILIQNYPASRDDIATIRTASARTKPALIEIKGLRLTQNTYPRTLRGTDSRAKRVPKDYKQKAHRIDLAVAPDETRPLNEENGPSGPFEKALRTFATGGPIPVVVGAFGEANKELDKLVIMCSKLAAKTAYGRRLSPHALGTSCGADSILRCQFRRMLGVQFAKANARLKLERLHLVGATPEEAVHLSRQQKRHNSRHWNPNTDCPSRFSANYGGDCNYQAWYEFRQSSRHFTDTL